VHGGANDREYHIGYQWCNMRHASNVKRFFLYSFACYGVLWTLIESVSAFIDHWKPTGIVAYGALVLVSIAIGLWRALPVRRIEIRVPNSDSSISVEFGDILTKTGCVAIQVNEYFDSILGNHVSTNSLHGLFIRDVLGGQSATFDSLVQTALVTAPFDLVTRQSGNTRRYKIGTTASVDINSKRYLLFAFAKTDTTTLKAYATVHEFWDALTGLWEGVRIHSNGEPVYVPLLGTGLSGVGLPERKMLELTMLSFFYHTKKNKVAKQVTIVLHKSLRRTIDLATIKAGGE
jgi:hypothetical protein